MHVNKIVDMLCLYGFLRVVYLSQKNSHLVHKYVCYLKLYLFITKLQLLTVS